MWALKCTNICMAIDLRWYHQSGLVSFHAKFSSTGVEYSVGAGGLLDLTSLDFSFFFFFFNFTILYWFCHISTWIHHRYTHVPYPEPSSLLPPRTVPSGSSQCTSPKHPVSCIEPGLATRFIYDIIHFSMPFSQIIPPSPSPTESKRLFYTSVSLLLSHFHRKLVKGKGHSILF